MVLGLPAWADGPISVSAKPHLKAHRGKLRSGLNSTGTPVHAAAFIRKRKIVLETQLLARPQKLRLIFTHEIFHFLWVKLGNKLRAEYRCLIAQELAAGAKGELGESACHSKDNLIGEKNLKQYVNESFCDTGAWLFSGVSYSKEFTLSARWRYRREKWMKERLQHS